MRWFRSAAGRESRDARRRRVRGIFVIVSGRRREKICAVVRCWFNSAVSGYHDEGVVVAALLDAFAAALAEIAHEDGENTPPSGSLLFDRFEDRGNLRVATGNVPENAEELERAPAPIAPSSDSTSDWRRSWKGGFSLASTAAFMRFRTRVSRSGGGREDVRVRPDRSRSAGLRWRDRAEILGRVGKGGVGTGTDALHALGAVLGR